jgi:hypothetical protein
VETIFKLGGLRLKAPKLTYEYMRAALELIVKSYSLVRFGYLENVIPEAVS